MIELPTVNIRLTENVLTTIRQFSKYIPRESYQYADVAECLGLFPVYFQKIFLATTGKKFNHYLNEQRISYAKQLLSASNCTLSQIASIVGYNNTQNFILNFKQLTGLFPTSFRNNEQEHYALIEENLLHFIYQAHRLKKEN